MTQAENEEQSHWVWDLYWQSGNFRSCVPVSDGKAMADLEAQWHSFFSKLPFNAHILDIGTGNGALATLGARHGRIHQKEFRVEGADAADIDPKTHVKETDRDLQAIVFHARTPIEETPFDAARFDAVCGQYAIEYSDTTRAVSEIARIIKPGGRIQFLVHADDSVLIERSRMQRDQAKFLKSSGLSKTLSETLECVRQAEKAEPDASRHEMATSSVARLKSKIERVAQAFAAHEDRSLPENYVKALLYLYQQRQNLSAAHLSEMLNDADKRLAAQIARLNALIEAAMDKSTVEELCTTLNEAGFTEPVLKRAIAGPAALPLGWWVNALRR